MAADGHRGPGRTRQPPDRLQTLHAADLLRKERDLDDRQVAVTLTAGLLVMPGALLFGALWERFGSATAFATAAAATALAGAVLVGLAGTRSRDAR